MNDKPDPFKHTKRDDRKEAISRADKVFCRKWTQAHRKGMPTAEITREWLAKVKGPMAPVYVPTVHAGPVTIDFVSMRETALESLAMFWPPKRVEPTELNIAVE